MRISIRELRKNTKVLQQGEPVIITLRNKPIGTFVPWETEYPAPGDFLPSVLLGVMSDDLRKIGL